MRKVVSSFFVGLLLVSVLVLTSCVTKTSGPSHCQQQRYLMELIQKSGSNMFERHDPRTLQRTIEGHGSATVIYLLRFL